MLKQAFLARIIGKGRFIRSSVCSASAWPSCCNKPERMLPTRSSTQPLIAPTKKYAASGRQVSVCSLLIACCLLFAATEHDPAEAEQACQQCVGVWFRNNHQIAVGLRECVGFSAHVEVVVNSDGPGAGAMLGEKRKHRQREGKSTDTARENISSIPYFMGIFLKLTILR